MATVVVLEVNEPNDVALARRAVAHLVADVHPDLLDNVRLTVSEVVVNAIMHGRPPVGLVARLDGQVLRVEVADTSPHRGAPQQASATASSGRGLAIVDALADRWGIESRGAGKAVWLEFKLAAPTLDRGMPVWLLQVPVETYLRSQEHLESTLHELQVLGTSEAEPFRTISTSTVVPLRKAMEAFQSVRHQGRAEAQAAASAGREFVDFAWTLPAEAAEAALVYGTRTNELEQLAQSGLLLTPPPDPEVSQLRQWLALEVSGQLGAGKQPNPFRYRPGDLQP